MRDEIRLVLLLTLPAGLAVLGAVSCLSDKQPAQGVGWPYDGAPPVDAGEGADVGLDAGHAETDAAAGVDSSSMLDAPADASDGGATFGATCAPPTVYEDSFGANPLLSGWQTVAGAVTYDPGNDLLELSAGSPNTQVWIGPRPAWTDYTISAEVRIDDDDAGSGSGGVNFRVEQVGAANDSGQMYFAGISTTQVILGMENGTWTPFATQSATFAPGTFYTLTVVAVGSTLTVSAGSPDGGTTTVAYTNTDADADANFAVGSFALRTYDMGMSYGAVTVTCN